uniref:Uncharacterized protein n=1 Tax=Candidatus Nitrotoga fabula TaxID=2182327 RepID=A0A2X0SDT0_9PROT|nr:conserved protein of unknown function [Candidatus Nitrotoga fabula]
MKNLNPEENGFADDIVGIKSYDAPKPQEKEFKPWHRPRKQYVRHNQWYMQIEELLSSINIEDVGKLKYFGLPGTDLLDLRYFHDRICKPKNIKLSFLGFNDAACPNSPNQTELDISLDEVRKLECVDQKSEVLGDNFCLIAKDNSIAWSKTSQRGPYDVINLDLCDGFAKHDPTTHQHTHYDAVNKLLSLQARRSKPWLFFITTRTGHEHVHNITLNKFINKITNNLNTCQSFKEASEKYLSISDGNSLQKYVINQNNCISKVFQTGLYKWLLGLAIKHHLEVKVKHIIGYRVNPKSINEDLVSIALEFNPILTTVTDGLGLAKNCQQKSTQSGNTKEECTLATEALKKIATNCINADKLLSDNDELHNNMKEESADLLTLARYDKNEYYIWLEKFS